MSHFYWLIVLPREERKIKRRVCGCTEEHAVVGVTEEDVEDRVRWRRVILCGNLEREEPKEETRSGILILPVSNSMAKANQ